MKASLLKSAEDLEIQATALERFILKQQQAGIQLEHPDLTRSRIEQLRTQARSVRQQALSADT